MLYYFCISQNILSQIRKHGSHFVTFQDTKSRNQVCFYHGEHLTVPGTHVSILETADTHFTGFPSGRLAFQCLLFGQSPNNSTVDKGSRDFGIRFNNHLDLITLEANRRGDGFLFHTTRESTHNLGTSNGNF